MQKIFEEEMTIKEEKCSKQMLTPYLESTILASRHTHFKHKCTMIQAILAPTHPNSIIM
jgi:hypothetical protein